MPNAKSTLVPDASGKIRDIFDLRDGRLLMVATDRISAFDVVLSDPIPNKGKVLTQLSAFWLSGILREVVSNHFLTTDMGCLPGWFSEYAGPEFLEWLQGRSMIVGKAEVLPVECIVRGYITGSGWSSYKKNGTVCGHKLPPELLESQQLPEPIFTPSTKAAIGDHDENISFEQMCDLLASRFGVSSQWARAHLGEPLRDISLELYASAAKYARRHGIIIADTKFEFGYTPGIQLPQESDLILIDEVLTPDSSRFWPASEYEPGVSQPSFDKQYVRDHLRSVGFDGSVGQVPYLSDEVIAGTARRYAEAYQRLTFV